MKKYALVKNGVVQAAFNSDLPKETFQDISDSLYEVNEDVQSNWLMHENQFYAPPEPVPALDSERNQINWVQPQVNFVTKKFKWTDAVVGASAAAVALAAQYFFHIFGG